VFSRFVWFYCVSTFSLPADQLVALDVWIPQRSASSHFVPSDLTASSANPPPSQEAQIFAPRLGLYMAPWIRDQMFYALSLLQALNLFWYYLILRILVR
jgi:hypothetical protein